MVRTQRDDDVVFVYVGFVEAVGANLEELLQRCCTEAHKRFVLQF